MEIPEMMVTVAVAVTVELACAVAVMVAVGVLGTELGAVYRPFASMLPHEVTPEAQETDQVTA
jgi:hypothetical protein